MALKDLAPGEGLEPSLSDFKDRRVASYTIPEKSRANDRTRTCIDESHNLAPDPFGHVRHQMAGMERLELSRSGLKNLSLARFPFIPISSIDAGEGNRTPKDARFKRAMSACCITPAEFGFRHASRLTSHASRLTHHVSRITHHASRLTHHASRITSHASLTGSGVRSLTG